MKPSRWVCFVALLVFLGSPSRMWSQRNRSRSFVNSRIFVQVRRANGALAPQGILVKLEAEDGGVVAQDQTDASGKVTFLPPQPGIFMVVVSEPGYREVQRRVDLTISVTSAVNIELIPLPSRQGLTETPQAAGDTVSVSSLGIPDGARKEFEAARKLLNENHDIAACIVHLQKAIELDDTFPQAYLMLGMAYLQTQKWKDAQRALEKAVQLNPQSGEGYLALGASLSQQKDYAAAEKALIRGLELNPNAPEGDYELAKTYWALGRWQEAEPHAVKAAAMQPNLPAVHVLMGNILLRKRDNQGALKEFEEYLRLEPNGSMAPAVRGVVDKIQKALAPAR